jgi:proton glutamate symport protein
MILAGTLAQFGLPLEGVAVILGVDALMDMARTSLNVLGNCLATVLMARWDGSFELSPDNTAVADALGQSAARAPAVMVPNAVAATLMD